MKNPEAGPVIAGTGGVRKLRIEDVDRKKAKEVALEFYTWIYQVFRKPTL
ncbi:MAG: hypothetical protein K2Q26_10245 [Bdellovibrionales bacterium]|nr:hypothetical protein [Bdellovibrionales bacterium]